MNTEPQKPMTQDLPRITWQSLTRLNFQAIKLDRRMVLGLDRVVKVRSEGERTGSRDALVCFDAEFLLFWIHKFVFNALRVDSIEEFSQLYSEIHSKCESRKELSSDSK